MRQLPLRVRLIVIAAAALAASVPAACALFAEPNYIVYSIGEPGARDIVITRPNGENSLTLTAGTDWQGADNYEPLWDPTRQRVAFLSNRDGNVEIYSMLADGSAYTRMTNSEFTEHQISWSNDGDSIAYTSEDPDGKRSVQHVSFSNLTPTPVIFGSDGETDPAWSPSERVVVFAKLNPEGESIGIYLRDPTNVNDVQLTAGPHRFPTWSPDGTRLAYVSTQIDEQEDVYIVGVSSAGWTVAPFRVTSSSARDYAPVWSPDGGSIAFLSDRDGNVEIYTAPSFQTQEPPTRLTRNAVDELSVQWGPTGMLLFPSGPEGSTDLFVMESNGQGQRRLTSGAPATQPDW